MTWLITGGAGYIGSHVVASFLAKGINVVILDDFSSGLHSRCPEGVTVFEGDICDKAAVSRALASQPIEGIVHLAAKKSVEESVYKPELYQRVNVEGTQVLLDAAVEYGVKNFLYSSSAAVYGEQDHAVMLESDICHPVSPYGATKLESENLVTAMGDKGMNVCSLRYFNVAGAANKQLADNSVSNLFPILAKALKDGKQPQIFGTDYATPDGTCIRDYVHVVDLANVHRDIAQMLGKKDVPRVINVGTGIGLSVKEVVDAMIAATGSDLKPVLADRRAGDPAQLIANVELLRETLGSVPQKGLKEIVDSVVNL